VATRDAIVLSFGGVRVRLYGGQGIYTPAQPTAYPAALPNCALNCLQLSGFSALRQELPRFGGVGKPSTQTLTVHDRGGEIGALFGPTLEGVARNTLASTVQAELGTTHVFADGDISSWLTEGYLYIGQETLHYTAKDDGLGRFTLHASGRGALDSLVREHLRDNTPARSFKPQITQRPVFWAHRKIVLSLHKVLEDGTICQTRERELLRGTLQREPEPTGSQAWTLRLVDELAKWDRFVGTGLETTELVDGWHYSDGERSCGLRYYVVLPEDSITGASDSVVAAARPVGGGAAGVVTVGSYGNHFRCFGTPRGANLGSPTQGPIRLHGDDPDARPSIPSGYAGSDYQINPDWGQAVNAGQVAAGSVRVKNAQVIEGIGAPGGAEFSLAAGLHRWPEAIIQAFNTHANCTTNPLGTMLYVDARLSHDGTRLGVVDSGYHTSPHNPVLFCPRKQGADPALLWYPLFRLIDETIDDGRDELNRGGPRDLGGDGPARVNENVVLAVTRSADAPVSYAYQAPATAFWQGGRYLLLRDDILPLATPANPGRLRATRVGNSAYTGEPLITILEYEAVAAQLDPEGNTIGYRVTITDETLRRFGLRDSERPDYDSLGPFGNWLLADGPKRAQITPCADLVGDPREVLLELMLSGFGGLAFPDASYSTLPRTYGLSCDPNAVDVAGILAYSLPRGTRYLEGFRQTKAIAAKALMAGILQSLGAALVMASIDGVQKITLIPVRKINSLRAVGAIEDRHWIANARPGSGKLDDKQSSWRFQANWDSVAQKFLRTPTFHDADVIDAKGGAQSNPVTLALRGLRIDQDMELLGLYQSLRYQYGTDKRVFTGEVSYDTAQAFTLGQVVRASIVDGLRSDGTPGLVSVPMQIIALSLNPLQKRCPITLLFDATRLSGYAPVCTIDYVIDANTVALSRDDYSFPQVAEWRYFLEDGETLPAGGVPVECVHVGEEELNTFGTLTGLAVATGEATIVGHGLLANDRIRVRDWDNTLAYLQVFVHLLGSGNVGLGAADDPPFRYA